MTAIAKTQSLILAAVAALFPCAMIHAHPMEYHMIPLDAQTVERVLTSFDRLIDKLENADAVDSARLPDDAFGITVILWSIEDAVAAIDKTRAVESPTLLQALQAAGYEDSPYIVAEWKIEAERVLEAYEVLRENYQLKDIVAELTELENNPKLLTDEKLMTRANMLTRKESMLQTTAKDLPMIKQYMQRIDALFGQLPD
ncbi:MAG: hypothetical protein LJE58_13930 [Thiogranum sp.]|nr:hypothetical protein [Thiogranum sp.]